MRGRALVAWLAAALAVPSLGAAPPAPVPEPLEDGSELLVVRLPDAPWSSLRLVVRAGGSQDPEGKAGVARMLARAVVDSPVDERGTRLEELVRRVGGRLSFRTTPTATIYELDAPSDPFLPLASDVIASVTSPRLTRVDLQREVRLINTEVEPRGPRLPWMRLERLLFPPLDPNAPLDGTPMSREKVEVDDLVAFFGKNYLTTAVTAVFAGAITRDQARALMDQNVRLPPALPDDKPAPARLDPPSLPVTEKQPAPVHFAAIGYRLDRGRRKACEAFARVADVRVAVAMARSGKAPWIEVRCLNLRGQDFLVASSPARQPDPYAFPDAVDRAFREAARTAPKPKDWTRIQQGAERSLELLAEDPAALADALADEAAVPRASASALTDVSAVFVEPAVNWSQVKDIARRSFREDRMFQLYLAPAE